MKRILSIALSLLLLVALWLPAGTASALTDYSTIKVRLVSMGSPSSVQFVVKGAYRIVEAPNVDLFPGVTYTIKPSGTAGLSLSWSDGTATRTASLGASATFKQYTNGSTSNTLYVNNPNYGWTNYTGDMCFSRPSGTSYLRLVNTLFLETYLYGVVSYEMSNSWPIEALKVQAVAARTYAMRYLKAADATDEYNIGDTSATQVYHGLPTTNANVVAAVDATKGMALTIGGSLVDGVFSASNGGYIRTASEKWGGSNTYHVAKVDPYDYANTSSPTFTYYIPKGGEGADLSALSSANQSKAKLFLSLLKAQIAKDEGVDASLVTINAITRVARSAKRTGSDTNGYEYTRLKVNSTVTIAPATSGGTSTTKNVTETILNYTNSTGGTAMELKTAFASYSSLINTKNLWEMYNTNDSKYYYITVRGYGHGVGMSQRGAQQMAKQGYKYTDILEFYYNFGDFDEYCTKDTKLTTYTLTQPKLPTMSLGTAPATAQVSVNSLNVRAAASTKGVVAGTLAKGVKVQLLSAPVTGWYKVFYPAAGLVGYCDATALTVVSGTAPTAGPTATPTASDTGTATPTPTSTATLKGTTTTSVNLRAQANTTSSILLVVPQNATVTILDTNAASGWYQVQYSGKTGYLMGKYITLVTASPTATATPTATVKPTPTPTATPTATPATVTAKTDKTASLRKSTSTSSTKLTSIAAGKTLTVLAVPTNTSWLKVKYGSKTGYVLNSYVTVGGSTHYRAGMVTAASLNIRKSASTTAAIVKTVNLNNVLVVMGKTTAGGKTWYKVKMGSTTGYAVSSYIRTAGTPVLLPGTVTAKTIKTTSLRTSASTSSTKLASISSGKSLTVTSVPTNTSWLKVTYSGKSGYVLKSYVTVGGSSSYRAGMVTATTLSLRTSASTSATLVGTLTKNAMVVVTGKKTAGGKVWYKVKSGSYTGYVLGSYVRVAGTPVSLSTSNEVTAKTLKTTSLRKSTSTSSAKLESIPKDKTLSVLTVPSNTSWVKVAYSSKTGYVLHSYVSVGGSSNYRAGVVTASSLNIRKSASTSAAVVKTVKRDQALVVMGKKSAGGKTWYKVAVGSTTGYAVGSYIRTAGTPVKL